MDNEQELERRVKELNKHFLEGYTKTQETENGTMLRVDFRAMQHAYLTQQGYNYVLWINCYPYNDDGEYDYTMVLKFIEDVKERLGFDLEEGDMIRAIFHEERVYFSYPTKEALWEAYKKCGDEFDFYYTQMIVEGMITNENT